MRELLEQLHVTFELNEIAVLLQDKSPIVLVCEQERSLLSSTRHNSFNC